MRLVEIALAKQVEPKKLEFSDLVIQMMDLGLGQKVATPDDIPGKLIEQGWSLAQVSEAWIGGSLVERGISWDIPAIQRLGGKCVNADSRYMDEAKS